jgi:hypothetical protein
MGDEGSYHRADCVGRKVTSCISLKMRSHFALALEIRPLVPNQPDGSDSVAVVIVVIPV